MNAAINRFCYKLQVSLISSQDEWFFWSLRISCKMDTATPSPTSPGVMPGWLTGCSPCWASTGRSSSRKSLHDSVFELPILHATLTRPSSSRMQANHLAVDTSECRHVLVKYLRFHVLQASTLEEESQKRRGRRRLVQLMNSPFSPTTRKVGKLLVMGKGNIKDTSFSSPSIPSRFRTFAKASWTCTTTSTSASWI